MVYLFCLSLDIDFMVYQDKVKKDIFTENSFHNYSYLYKIIKQEDLLGEMIEIYNKPTFLYNLNDQPINKLLNFNENLLHNVLWLVVVYVLDNVLLLIGLSFTILLILQPNHLSTSIRWLFNVNNQDYYN